ncbi:hypothetical protein BKA67DRAFT_10015 [Truncatella angustata]|uniref:BZIP domain-containing protein n=1 Tax=Truncatella angustata TaxID=152316 RepID=A0A9P8UVT3_9PEZI|nr:uncharacterized protein BKA67DRAFT_10015 [Truncatella angustata]KAH6659293.1 hypothetical protein BKA67DRAFT_10015 [Truncatella angustata]
MANATSLNVSIHMADMQTARVSASSSSANPQKRPKSRQRVNKPAPTLNVPDINEDAAERKRILNVLAQRRYRQRRRQKRVAASRQDDDSTSDESPQSGSVPGNTVSGTATAILQSPQHSASWPEGALSTTIPDLPLATNDISTPTTAQAPTHSEGVTTIPTSLLIQNIDTDPSLIFDFSASDSSQTRPPAGPPPTFTFPDTYLLPVPELKLLQAFMRLSSSLNCKSSLWDLTATSSFNDPSMTFNQKVLTSSFAPTVAQRTVPHHPIIDVLPWPSVRDRLIGVFSLPDDCRPPCAVGPLALVQLAYDMEDSAEGIRIWGHSPCNGSMWEVGQVLFQRWWFVFDRQVIEQSNRWRLLRGAPELRLGNQQTIEEITA